MRRWGNLLVGLVTGELALAQRLTLKCPTSADMTEHFDTTRVRSWALRELVSCRVMMREFRHRVLGANAVPQQVWIYTLEQALALIGQQKAARRFGLLRDATREQSLYDDLRDNRLRKGLRLEQEQIGFGWVEAALARLSSRARTAQAA